MVVVAGAAGTDLNRGGSKVCVGGGGSGVFHAKVRKLKLFAFKCLILVLLTVNFYFLITTPNNNTSDNKIQVRFKEINRQNFFLNGETAAVSEKKRKYHQVIPRTSVLRGDNNIGERYKFDDGDQSVLITVKTTSFNYDFKIRAIINTWFRLVPSKVIFFG
jgi:hypothetical protein